MEILIGKDIRDYKVRDAGPFTLREAGFGFAGLAVLYAGYFVFDKMLGLNAPLLFSLPSIPFFLLGFVRPYGLPFEKWFRSVAPDNFINPRIRLYKTDMEYDAADFLEGEALEEFFKEEPAEKPTKMTKEQKQEYKGYR